MAATKLIITTALAASLAALAQAETSPRLDQVLERSDEVGHIYYEQETRWVRDKQTHCAQDAGEVERILDHRDRGGSLGELVVANGGEEAQYYLRIAVNHWNDTGTAHDTARTLYDYCIERGTYWSPLGPLKGRKG